MFRGFAARDKKKIKDALREDLEGAAGIIIPALERLESTRSTDPK
jgi:hypothetical protein